MSCVEQGAKKTTALEDGGKKSQEKKSSYLLWCNFSSAGSAHFQLGGDSEARMLVQRVKHTARRPLLPRRRIAPPLNFCPLPSITRYFRRSDAL
jgi:hypothetical protein